MKMKIDDATQPPSWVETEVFFSPSLLSWDYNRTHLLRLKVWSSCGVVSHKGDSRLFPALHFFRGVHGCWLWLRQGRQLDHTVLLFLGSSDFLDKVGDGSYTGGCWVIQQQVPGHTMQVLGARCRCLVHDAGAGCTMQVVRLQVLVLLLDLLTLCTVHNSQPCQPHIPNSVSVSYIKVFRCPIWL